MNFPATVYLGHITLSVLWKCTGPINEFILWLLLCREAERERVGGGAKLQMWTLICEWPLVLILPNWNLGQWRHNLFPLSPPPPPPGMLLPCPPYLFPISPQARERPVSPACTHLTCVCAVFFLLLCFFKQERKVTSRTSFQGGGLKGNDEGRGGEEGGILPSLMYMLHVEEGNVSGKKIMQENNITIHATRGGGKSVWDRRLCKRIIPPFYCQWLLDNASF